MNEGRNKRNIHLDVNYTLNTMPNNFDATFFLLLIKRFELALFLPVIKRADNNLEENKNWFKWRQIASTHDYSDSNHDSNTFNPIHRWLAGLTRGTKILK